jgi:hypothetical protein
MKVIRTAYAWLAVAFAIDVWFASRALGSWSPDFFEAGVVRHALALGFATQMIFGVGRRLIPALAARAVRGRLALDISFWMLNLAIVTRVLYAPFSGGSTLVRFDHIAWSGATALIALLLFVYGMLRSALAHLLCTSRFGPAQCSGGDRMAVTSSPAAFRYFAGFPP